MRGLERLKVLVVWVGDVGGLRNHVAHHRRVVHDLAQAILDGGALQQVVLAEVLAQIGEVVERVGPCAHSRGKRHDLLVLTFGEAQDQIARHGDLWSQSFGAETTRVNAIECHEASA